MPKREPAHPGGEVQRALAADDWGLAARCARAGAWGRWGAAAHWRGLWTAMAIEPADGRLELMRGMAELWASRWGPSRLPWSMPAWELLAEPVCQLALATAGQGATARQARRCLRALGASWQGGELGAAGPGCSSRWGGWPRNSSYARLAEQLAALGAKPGRSFVAEQMAAGRWEAMLWAAKGRGFGRGASGHPHWWLCQRLVGGKAAIEALGMACLLSRAKAVDGLESWEPAGRARAWAEALEAEGADPSAPGPNGKSAAAAMEDFMRGAADCGADAMLARAAREACQALAAMLASCAERKELMAACHAAPQEGARRL